MRIVPNATQNPIATPALLQTHRADPVTRSGDTVVLAPSVAFEKAEVAGPLMVNVLGARIELHPDEMAKMVDKMNDTARIFNHALRFQMSEGHRIRVQVINVTTGDVVRDIPPEKFMDTFTKMQNAIGVIFDERV